MDIRKAEGDKWTIYIEATNEFRDAENEVVLQKAMQEAQDAFLKQGQISWDHMHKDAMRSRPRYIIGEPLDVRFTENDRRSTLVKAQLYQKNKVAQDLMDNLESGSTRFGASIGGRKLSKSSFGRIDKLAWDEVAITYKPVNASTMGTVQLAPMEEFVKALMAGSGVNPENFSGGRAITKESLLTVVPEDEVDWYLQDAIRDQFSGALKAAFKLAIKYIAETRNYTSSGLAAFLVRNKVKRVIADTVCSHVEKNLPQALHVLGTTK